MAEPFRRVPENLLDLASGNKDDLLSPDGVVLARAALDAVADLPLLSSSLAARSQWLAFVRELVVDLGDDCPDDVEIRMLACISRTALVAHQTSPGLATAEHALSLALECGDLLGQILARAGRLPFLAHKAPVEANRDMRQLDADWAELQEVRVGPLTNEEQWIQAEVLLARLAYYGATGDLSRVRGTLGELGRVQLPKRPGLTFVAYASQAVLLQLWLREGRYDRAINTADDALMLCEQEAAWAEYGNLCAVRAALAMLEGDIRAAIELAHRSVGASKRSSVQSDQPDPWLGLPFDMSPAKSPAEAVQTMAEAVLAAQDLADAPGFLMSAAAMGAFYLSDDRALEALDALNEASQVAKSLADPNISPALRHIAEQTLDYLGVLRR